MKKKMKRQPAKHTPVKLKKSHAVKKAARNDLRPEELIMLGIASLSVGSLGYSLGMVMKTVFLNN